MIRIVRTVRALALVSLAALLATAVAQGMNHGHAHGGGTPPSDTSAPMGTGMGMGGMSMATQTVDEATFLVHMIPHHREAVATAEALRAVTERPELIELLDAIVATQNAEIAAMEGWLDAWHPDVDRDVAYAPMMRDLGADAAVADAERAFLEDMIGHHMMAVHEAQALLAGDLAEHPEVAELARRIVADQMAEMHQMMSWLRAWFGVAAPMGMGAMGMGPMGMGPMGNVGGMDQGSTGGMGGMGMGSMDGTGSMGTGAGGGMHGAGGGMHGAGGGMHGAGGSMAAHHEAMHGGASGTTVGAAEAERLALAFMAGRGDAAAAVADTVLVYEVVVRSGDAEHVLRVDARTGQVTLLSER
jgi:uncharacterized protein (DUF305 family)